jgi:hypothetical protein
VLRSGQTARIDFDARCARERVERYRRASFRQIGLARLVKDIHQTLRWAYPSIGTAADWWRRHQAAALGQLGLELSSGVRGASRWCGRGRLDERNRYVHVAVVYRLLHPFNGLRPHSCGEVDLLGSCRVPQQVERSTKTRMVSNPTRDCFARDIGGGRRRRLSGTEASSSIGLCLKSA